ncbi:DUF371 domain-containing protein [Candidatus Woesearchaeota archaeon]|nr:MAG: DUF371 domain-containing protein [Candidatus Woesearchaeota archaeon]
MPETATFTARGHEQILATHRNTLEFTKDTDLTSRGNCIVGVSSDFDSALLRKIASQCESFVMTIECNGIKDSVRGQINREFSHDSELVIRITDFKSKRTFGVRADKASIHLDRKLVEQMKKKDAVIRVKIECDS